MSATRPNLEAMPEPGSKYDTMPAPCLEFSNKHFDTSSKQYWPDDIFVIQGIVEKKPVTGLLAVTNVRTSLYDVVGIVGFSTHETAQQWLNNHLQSTLYQVIGIYLDAAIMTTRNASKIHPSIEALLLMDDPKMPKIYWVR